MEHSVCLDKRIILIFPPGENSCSTALVMIFEARWSDYYKSSCGGKIGKVLGKENNRGNLNTHKNWKCPTSNDCP